MKREEFIYLSFEVDLDEDFSELKGKMSIETHKTNDVKQTETKIFSMKRWMYVAASLVLVLGALAVMQFGMNGSAVMLSASTQKPSSMSRKIQIRVSKFELLNL